MLDTIDIASLDGSVVFKDSLDHFTNALLRLMQLEQSDVQFWIEAAAKSEGDLIERLAHGWLTISGAVCSDHHVADSVIGPGPCGVSGVLLHCSITESPSHGVAQSVDGSLGWLVNSVQGRYLRTLEPPSYEKDYFEGDRSTAGGYGAYAEQAQWRLEKAARQVQEMREVTKIDHGRVLDLGCGYGYFLVGLRDAGYEQEGLEISEFARSAAREWFALDTYGGVLGDHKHDWSGRFDIITGFDLIEHIADTDVFLRDLVQCLRPGGVVGLRTPNLDCPEADVFGPSYHSLKREHLLYFTPKSLTAAASVAGLQPVSVKTTSHLLIGFVGEAQTTAWASEGRGSDIIAWFRRPE